MTQDAASRRGGLRLNNHCIYTKRVRLPPINAPFHHRIPRARVTSAHISPVDLSTARPSKRQPITRQSQPSHALIEGADTHSAPDRLRWPRLTLSGRSGRR